MSSLNVIASAQVIVPVIGIQGVPGTTVVGTIFVIADQALGGNRVVKSTPTGCDYADCSNTLDYGLVIGFTASACGAGILANIINSGELNGFSGLTPGFAIYLGENGTLTQVIPTSGILQQLGVAKTSESIIVSLSQPINLGV